MMKTQTVLASLVSGLLFLAPVVKADDQAAAAPKAEKKAKHTKCECGDCKKGKCEKKKCEHCEHHTKAAAEAGEQKADEPGSEKQH